MAILANNFKNWLDDQTRLSGQPNFALSAGLRSASLDILNRGTFPTRKDEEWRYTPLKNLLSRELHTDSGEGVDRQSIEKFKQAVPEAQHLVFVNGAFSNDLSDNLELQSQQGLQIRLMSKLGEASKHRAEETIRTAKLSDDNIFQHVALALSKSGLFVELEKDSDIERPLHLLYVNSSLNMVSISNPVNVIHTGANSRLKIIQQFASLSDAQAVSIPADYIKMDDASVLDFYRIGLESEGTDHISNTAVQLGSAAELYAHQYLLGSRLTRSNMEISFGGPGGLAILRGVFSGDKSQHLDLRTYMDHAHPSCISDQHFRGIMNGQSRGVFNGLVLVREQAQKTDARQSNKNLLLSRDARVDTKPQLEIFADDVKCTHGATVGELDEDALFYLQSRGISKQDAALMLTRAFAAEIIEDIRIETLKAYIHRQISIGLDGIQAVHV
ncbi:Fe-S cluster assembly protein SufD [bacterium]|nr:Fe-S cluster assembly protein SufD [bacterium]